MNPIRCVRPNLRPSLSVGLFGVLRCFAAAVLAAGVIAVPPRAPAQAAVPDLASDSTGAGAPREVTRELTREDLEPWLDGMLTLAMESGDIAGGVVAVVKGGEILLQKGYGFADLERRIPVDPQRTLFRVGSISKLFTWISVMQLVEQGRLDLDRDINEYLDFGIPKTFGRPITLRHLMTHTAGFEETVNELIYTRPETFPSLKGYLQRHLPPRMFPPGEVPAYSNYGTGLAGYIVERVSGEPFEVYLERHILGPLGMHRTTIRQPLPPDLAPDMSRGYPAASEAPIPFELAHPAPAGGVTASGEDMARFMIALLQAEVADGPILRSATARQLYRSTTTHVAGVNGTSLGFEVHREEPRIIGHGGDTQVFHSDMKLFLDEGIGLFVAFNSSGRNDAAFELLVSVYRHFLQRYSPTPVAPETADPTALERAKAVARQRYRGSRGADSSFLKLLGLLAQEQPVVHADGTISFPSFVGANGQPRVWAEIAPYVWRERGGTERLAARVVDGRVTAVAVDSFTGMKVLLPVPAWQSAALILPVVLVALAVLVIALVSWPVGVIIRYRMGERPALAGWDAWLHRAARLGALAQIVALAGWLAMLQSGLLQLALYDGGAHGSIRLLHGIGLIGVLGAAAAVWSAWRTCRGNYGLAAKAWSVAVAAAAAVVVWFQLAFNLLTFGLRY